jgi:hypothetical protein
MSETGKFPAVHIDRRHQSAPRETEADKAVRLAADEIREGHWKPDQKALDEIDSVPGLALRAGNAEAVNAPWTQQDFDQTDESLVLAGHPRVQEALARLEAEKQESKSGQEYVERAAMIQETIENTRRAQRWEGQERWQNDDVLEARKGKILSPIEFYERLMRDGLGKPPDLFASHDIPCRQVDYAKADGGEDTYVRAVGTGRILLARHVKKVHPWDKSGRVALLTIAHADTPLILPGQAARFEEPVQIATVQWPFSTEWMVMRFDEFGVPRTPRYLGWRTALLALIRGGYVSEEEAHRAFPVGLGPEATWYKQQIFEWSGRN